MIPPSDSSEARVSRNRGNGPFSDELHPDGDHEPWLVSYADMMTLLVGLFAMMFSFASFDESSAERMSKALTSTFGQTAEDPAERVKRLSEQIKSAMALTPYLKDMQLRQTDRALEVSFTTTSLFETGSVELTPEADTAMRALAGRIRALGKEAWVKVEGHTDDAPISSSRFASNWILSSARAAEIVYIFESMNFPSDRLEASGFGASRPLVPNLDGLGRPIPENRARNRRVVVKVSFAKDAP